MQEGQLERAELSFLAETRKARDAIKHRGLLSFVTSLHIALTIMLLWSVVTSYS